MTDDADERLARVLEPFNLLPIEDQALLVKDISAVLRMHQAEDPSEDPPTDII